MSIDIIELVKDITIQPQRNQQMETNQYMWLDCYGQESGQICISMRTFSFSLLGTTGVPSAIGQKTIGHANLHL